MPSDLSPTSQLYSLPWAVTCSKKRENSARSDAAITDAIASTNGLPWASGASPSIFHRTWRPFSGSIGEINVDTATLRYLLSVLETRLLLPDQLLGALAVGDVTPVT